MKIEPVTKRLARKVLLVGWDAADWQVIHPLMDQGLMPTLQRFVEEGVMGNLGSLDPMYSPCLWTSIATGKRMHKHGIHWFLEPDANRLGVTVPRSTTRQCKAIWNMLTQAGLRTHAVGWLASHPAEPINGVCVTDGYATCAMSTARAVELEEGGIYPEDAIEPLAALRIDPLELTEEVLWPFLPEFRSLQAKGDARVAVVAKLLAECFNLHNAATWALAHRDWDFAAVYYDSIDHFCHAFMRYHPPRLENLSQADFENYSGVVTACYRFHDMMLARLLDLAGPDATVILVSDHGFQSGALRPREIPCSPAGNVIWHRYHGVFAMKGPHVRKDEWIHDLNLLDVTPTVLALFGLPVGADMDGKPILNAFESPWDSQPPPVIASWEDVPGECGQHSSDKLSAADSQAAVDRLIELGYVELDATAETNIVRNRQQARFALASDYYEADMFDDAIGLLEELMRDEPGEHRFSLRLVQCYQAAGRLPEARQILKKLFEERPSEPTIALIGGSLELHAGNLEAAARYLAVAEENESSSLRPLPWLWVTKGQLCLRRRRWSKAEAAFERALTIDPNLPAAHYGLSVSCFRTARLEKAASCALHAISLRPNYPAAHYQLGLVLVECAEYDQAANAFRTALLYDPAFDLARQQLSSLPKAAGATQETRLSTNSANLKNRDTQRTQAAEKAAR
jgi:predicted AlkP superfamily phosphohydrolase/phosphomutase/Tfp pilus assembly protein PilF